MKRKQLRVYFTDFWDGFNTSENFFTELLSADYEIIIDPVDPEILFFSLGSFNFLQYKKAVRVFFTGESYLPDFTVCDFSLSFDYDSYDGRNLRLPLYTLFGKAKASMLLKPKIPGDIILEKILFCNMVVSQSKCRYRIEFYNTLNKMRKVDSGGKVLNTVGGPVKDKMAFIKNYKFTIAMENRSHPGYTTEKIFEPMMANSIPIYWGNPKIAEEFNPKSFINISDFGSLKEAAAYVVSVDDDMAAYKKILAEPWFNNNEINKYFGSSRLLHFFETKVLKAYPFSPEQIKERDKIASLSVFKKKWRLFITRKSF